MKLLLSLSVALVAVASVQAQVFRPHHSGGHDRRHGHGHGAAIHAGRGFGHGHFARPIYVGSPYRSHGYGRFHAVPVLGYYDGYTGYDYPYYGGVSYGSYGGSAAANGLLLGALAGGIIGHNSGEFRHNGWRGAAWGAGLGWLLGTVADANRRAVTYVYPSAANSVSAVAPAISVTPAPAAAAAPAQPVTIINHYYGAASPMSGVNGLFGR